MILIWLEELSIPWIVATCKPNQEAIAEVNLTRQGYLHYCPYYQKQQGKTWVKRPLFARYIFISIEQFWTSILGTRGISRVLLGDSGPQTINASVIKDLKNREVNGFVQLIPPPKFFPGEKLKATEGPLMGHSLICAEMLPHERVLVLMDLLGRRVPVELDEKALSAA